MLENIVRNSKYVVEHASYVSIDEEKLKIFANQIKTQKSIHWLSNNPFGLLELSKEELCMFLLIYGSIDFCFWGKPKWTIEINNGTLDGAFALLYALLKEVKNNKFFLTPTYLKELDKKEWARILKGNTKISLFEERFNRIKMIGNILLENNITSFYEEIKNLTVDTDLFMYLINTFPFLNDSRTFQNKTIYFYKLAQLLANDILHLRSLKENINVDTSHLIGCADYKLPQVIHQFGITNYINELEEKIINKEELLENSIEEIEIRAATIVVIQKLSHLTGIDAIEINDLIWLQSQDKSKKWKPYHLTKTTSY